MHLLITGAAGFIGFHLSNAAIAAGYNVIGIDNMNDYYSTQLKNDRLSILKKKNEFTFKKCSIENRKDLEEVFNNNNIKCVINLAAYAGVRHSLSHPQDYIDANITGFMNILELSKKFKIKHLIYASSSSVYGSNEKLPSYEEDNVDHPVSLYGATKKANELMAHTYSHLFDLPTTGLRFFTVYGPWGRPDMALFMFTESIINNRPIELFNHGKHKRDFTYVDDIVSSIIKLINHAPSGDLNYDPMNPNPSTSNKPWRILNIGNNESVKLTDFVSYIEKAVGKKSIINLKDFQLGDVENSFANTDKLNKITNFKPYTPLKEGIKQFVEWYKEYYKV